MLKLSILHNINYRTNVVYELNGEYCVFNIIVDITNSLMFYIVNNYVTAISRPTFDLYS